MRNQVALHTDNDYNGEMRARGGRKRHVQCELFRHGGKRKGAGRRAKHGDAGALHRKRDAGAAHRKRDAVDGRDAMHVTLRVVSEVGRLRRDDIYKAVRAASVTAAERGRFRIVHLSIQHDHIHMLVEAESAAKLASGMHGFKISAARHINTVLAVDGRRRRGRVFAGRYHVVVIRCPRQARHVLAYILQNWRKHGEDRHGLPSTWLVDKFSSGISFAGWKEREGEGPWPIPAGYDPVMVAAPRSWLLREGWKRHGPISVHEVPSRGALGS